MPEYPDFMKISESVAKNKVLEIFPKFVVRNSVKDLMIRGGDFYAIWNPATNMWCTDEDFAYDLMDNMVKEQYLKMKESSESSVRALYSWDCDSGVANKWHYYLKNQMRDNFHPIDEKLIFSNTETKREDYASKKLNYSLAEGDISSYDRIMSVLYSEEERKKIEWAVGAVISGDSKKIQKFIVLYGSAGTGKSTVLNIIQMLFDGYYSIFDAKALGSGSDAFALEPLKNNPLVAIQHDGDLSKIEDNTRLNSIVSHEEMIVNEKYRGLYSMRFNSFLFMGTNKPVKITDAKSGIIRRLIDVSPTGNKIPFHEYNALMDKIKFELGGIAYHCLEVYNKNKHYYDNYIPQAMLGASNDFYNFVLDSFSVFSREEFVTLKQAWEMYKVYCDDAKVMYPYNLRNFKEELKNYFEEFFERYYDGEGERIRSIYKGFIRDKFEYKAGLEEPPKEDKSVIFKFNCIRSIFDKEYADCKAQYANDNETPEKKWSEVETKLSDLDTSQLHYIRVPKDLIVIDFDLKDENGNKSFEKNLEAANKWPKTYAELSKSGAGIHLHYIYTGDVEKLSRVYDDGIEIKVFKGNSSLRRKLTKCNNEPIASINSGLPLKGENKVVSFDAIKSEKGLRTIIKRNLNKEYHSATKPSVDFIFKNLEDAYASGMKYDVTDMRPEILAFAANSTHQSLYCIKLVNKMKFKSDEASEVSDSDYDDSPYVFFDVEIFPNVCIVVYKFENGNPVKLINPTPSDIEALVKFKLIGFNCRRYDNHILYAIILGYTNLQLYNLSTSIIEKGKNCFFSEAYNLSYTDVFDFAAKKQSLKKWEIELEKHHLENSYDWNQPLDKSHWDEVADYCVNDVLATEAVFNHLQGDFTARKILADVAGGVVNDTTNTLTTKIIFGNNRNPQERFHYRDLSKPVKNIDGDMYERLLKHMPNMLVYSSIRYPDSTLPYFEGYKFDNGISTYKGETVGEGGFVWAQPGMYSNVITFDVASMHPHSIISEDLFGPYTENMTDLVNARIAIKHKDYEKAKQMLNGKLSKYLNDTSDSKSLSQALKIAINSVYGLTAAKFDNPFHDPRNKDNIVAKRGALFMIDLLKDLQEKGVNVVHIKTDSIKVENPSDEIKDYILKFGEAYGYTFEIEHIFEKICLVNDAVYVAKLSTEDEDWISDCEKAKKEGKPEPTRWTATGTQFQIPYVFKTVFSKDPIIFKDLCETKSVSTSMSLDMNENLGEDEHNYIFVGKIGLFCPIKNGCGGGLLMRDNGKGGYGFATGSKGYRWLESEMVKNLGRENDINKDYYNHLVDAAIASLEEFGDVEWFLN